MAATPPAPEIQALIDRGSRARAGLTSTVESLRDKLNPKVLLADSVQAHPGRWLAGATATGLIASRALFRRKPKKEKALKSSHPVLFFILRNVSNAAMPAVKIWLLAQIKSYLMNRALAGKNPLTH